VIEKLRPDRDLQCFFFEPSAIAAMSGASSTGFTLSGTWRQQFDWAVIEWNRDNTHEHPAFRNLPDGDLSGLVLTYRETRTNCIPLDSDLFATVDWPSLRVWATPEGGTETIYWVPLKPHATPVAGSYQSAYADFTLSGTVAAGDFVGLAFLAEHYTYQVVGGDTLTSVVANIAGIINSSSTLCQASATGTTLRVFYTGGGPVTTSTPGANGNRFGMYSFATGAGTWDAAAKTFANGTSPALWQVTLDFSSLQGTLSPDLSGVLVSIPTNRIRKIRWTYAADLQMESYQRSEFQVVVSDWTVTGTGRAYSVAGPGSRRIEDHAIGVTYSGSWVEERGNYSGGTIHHSASAGDSVTLAYAVAGPHTLYTGLRYLSTGATIAIAVDGVAAGSVNAALAGEDVLFRFPVGSYGGGTHTLTLTNSGGGDFYFDFVEMAVATTTLPTFEAQLKLTLATDWDTEHSLALPPERTAWMIDSLGFTGRQNHYAGALWFYELTRVGTEYASGMVTFAGMPAFSSTVTVTVGRAGDPSSNLKLTKLVHMGMTASMMATAYAIELNRGYTGVWASASGAVLTIRSRSMGTDGNNISLAATTTSGGFSAAVSGSMFTGGVDGDWRTDLAALPRLNRAVRDWSASFLAALRGYGIDSTVAFSMEIGNPAEPLVGIAIAQEGPAGDAIVLPTPSVQTNFSPASLAFWQEVYLEMAALQAEAGLTPYLQFGEVQWWYFPNDGAGRAFSGMPFYDSWTQSRFAATHGRAMATITANTMDPATIPEEVAFLAGVLGGFTISVMSFVRASYPTARFEVLYPTDVNRTALNRAINYPADWNPSALTCLKTESFGFTLGRNLELAEETIGFGEDLGFLASERSHLVGVGDSTTAWEKESRVAVGKGFESVVLFALDQFCLVGYRLPLPAGLRRSVRMGS
jgi:hypothetical protein